MLRTNTYFHNKTILITGSSRGIGQYMAQRFAALGSIIIVNYSQSAADAYTTVSTIEKQGGQAVAIKANISDRDMVESMYSQILSKYGHLDILINNAGAVFKGDDWTKTIATNLTGTYNCLHAAMPIMKNQESGKILNISSLRSILGATDIAAYAAAKAGVDNLTKSFAKILSPYVNVNSLVLGRIDGGMNQIKDNQTKNELANTNLLKRLGSLQDVFQTAKFLVSNKSSFITGQSIILDGGASLK